jgi:hypothetical protein
MKAMMEELAASGLSEEEILEKTQVSHPNFLQLNPDPAARKSAFKNEMVFFF